MLKNVNLHKKQLIKTMSDDKSQNMKRKIILLFLAVFLIGIIIGILIA